VRSGALSPMRSEISAASLQTASERRGGARNVDRSNVTADFAQIYPAPIGYTVIYLAHSQQNLRIGDLNCVANKVLMLRRVIGAYCGSSA